MDNQDFSFIPHPHLHVGGDHHTSPLIIDATSVLSGAADHFTTFNSHSLLSYLSLLSSTNTTNLSAADATNYLHLKNLPADSAQKMTNGHLLEHQTLMKSEQVLAEQKLINAQILEQQNMITTFHFLEEEKMMNSYIVEQKKMINNGHFLGEKGRCVKNDEKLKKILVKNKKEKLGARKRREKIMEKNMYLRKLLPWVAKMDIATMYDETAKYIKFLQAQLKVLNSMPLNDTTLPPSSHSSSSNSYSGSSSCLGPGSYPVPYLGAGWDSGLGLSLGSGYSSCSGNGGGVELLSKLSRQEVLKVMMNSPRVQMVLSKNGWCLYTAEQMVGMLENKVAVTGEAPGDVLPSYLLDGMLWNYY